MAWRRFKEFSGQGLRKGSFAGLCNFIVYAGGGGGVSGKVLATQATGTCGLTLRGLDPEL